MDKPKFVPPEQAQQRLFRTPQGQVKLRPLERAHAKLGRNQPCPCGSMRKFKKCHGAKVEVKPAQQPNEVDLAQKEVLRKQYAREVEDVIATGKQMGREIKHEEMILYDATTQENG